MGDAFLVDFPSVVHAVQCAHQIQSQLWKHNAEKAKAEQIHVCIGIHLGDVVQKDGDVFGDGVNVAVRLHQAHPFLYWQTGGSHCGVPNSDAP
jgi:class 3 adenylate cyclase